MQRPSVLNQAGGNATTGTLTSVDPRVRVRERGRTEMASDDWAARYEPLIDQHVDRFDVGRIDAGQDRTAMMSDAVEELRAELRADGLTEDAARRVLNVFVKRLDAKLTAAGHRHESIRDRLGIGPSGAMTSILTRTHPDGSVTHDVDPGVPPGRRAE